MRRLRIDGGELVTRVDVDRRAVALQLPVARDADVAPRRGVDRVGRRIGGQGAHVVRVAEFPHAVERTVGIALLEGARERLVARSELHEFGAGRFAVALRHSRIEVVGKLGADCRAGCKGG